MRGEGRGTRAEKVDLSPHLSQVMARAEHAFGHAEHLLARAEHLSARAEHLVRSLFTTLWFQNEHPEAHNEHADAQVEQPEAQNDHREAHVEHRLGSERDSV